uniref:G-protein coupled receptors family 1 profile domain-containing protein n=1 Tax=Oncorhynchus tshawytscha TaxID=74940 RepID=A0A8C8IBL8_ONCTS
MGFSVLLYNGMESSDDGFYITAFHTLGNKNYLILALSIIYFFIINTSLPNPKDVAVWNLTIVDISLNTVIIPQMVPVFVFNLNYVSIGTCFSQMFFTHFLGDIDSFFLALLAYDRVIAICFPLRYITINTNLRLLLILVGIWTLAFLLEVSPVALASSLPYCASRVVHSSCCEHSPVYRLASFRKLATAKSLVVLLGPRSFIIFTYAVIVYVVIQMSSSKDRRKTFNTCVSHMIVVACFFIPKVLLMLVTRFGLVLTLSHRNGLIIGSTLGPSLVNPLVYCLKTKEIRGRLKYIFRRTEISPNM